MLLCLETLRRKGLEVTNMVEHVDEIFAQQSYQSDFKEQGELSGITSEAAVKPDGKEYVQPAETIHKPCRAQAVEEHYEAKLAFFEAKVENLSRACAQDVGVQTEPRKQELLVREIRFQTPVARYPWPRPATWHPRGRLPATAAAVSTGNVTEKPIGS